MRFFAMAVCIVGTPKSILYVSRVPFVYSCLFMFRDARE